jgi:hypothetical protein
VPRKVFVSGEILTASDVNVNLMDQSVMVFDDSAARGSAIPSPIEGMVTYLKDTDSLEKFDGSAFVNAAPQKILQVASTAKTDASFSTSSTTPVGLTGLSVSITPSSTSSKVLVIAEISYGVSNVNTWPRAFLLRGATAIGIGDAAGSRIRVSGGGWSGDTSSANAQGQMGTMVLSFLDSPNTTSSTTYSVDIGVTNGTIFINRSQNDTDNTSLLNARGASNIIVMEVAG